MIRRTPLALSVVLALGLANSAHAAGTLNFANWSDYFPPELLKKFEADTGIKATLDAYDSNVTLLAKLKAGGGSYDVIVPSDSFIQIMVQEDLLQKFDQSKLPNLKNLAPTFQNLSFDPKNDYTVPYLWGTTGYSYDSAKVADGKLKESWGPFFQPPEDLKGKVVALNSADDLYPPAARYLGIDVCTEDPKEAKKIQDLLLAQKPMLAMYNSDGTIERMARVKCRCTSSGTVPSPAPMRNAPAWCMSIRRKAFRPLSTTSPFPRARPMSRKRMSSSTG